MEDLIQGGGFLLQSTSAQRVFTPEDFNEEHRMIVRTTSRFVEQRIMPVMDDLEAQKDGIIPRLLKEARELGLLGAEIPSEYDGTEMDKISATIIAEEFGKAGAFSQAHGGQTGMRRKIAEEITGKLS
ncbi:MAG: acyl-CoA dehydrogenase family protein [Syntrophobacteraceae bacterium]